MAIDLRAYGFHGVVEVHAAKIFEPNNLIKLMPESLVALGRSYIITSGKGMARVYADTDTALIFHSLNDIAEMAESKAHIGALPRGVLYHGRDAMRRVESAVDALGNEVEACFGGNLLEVAAGMKIETVETEDLAATQFVDEGIERLLPFVGVGVAEVDEITIVWEDLCRGVATLLAIFLERLHFGGVEVPGSPLALVLGEEGESRGPYGSRIEWNILHTATCGYVRTDIFHTDIIFIKVLVVKRSAMITLFQQTAKSILAPAKPNVDANTYKSREQ